MLPWIVKLDSTTCGTSMWSPRSVATRIIVLKEEQGDFASIYRGQRSLSGSAGRPTERPVNRPHACLPACLPALSLFFNQSVSQSVCPSVCFPAYPSVSLVTTFPAHVVQSSSLIVIILLRIHKIDFCSNSTGRLTYSCTGWYHQSHNPSLHKDHPHFYPQGKLSSIKQSVGRSVVRSVGKFFLFFFMFMFVWFFPGFLLVGASLVSPFVDW